MIAIVYTKYRPPDFIELIEVAKTTQREVEVMYNVL